MKVLLLKKDGVSIEGEFKALNESYIDKINVKQKDTKYSRYRKVEYAD